MAPIPAQFTAVFAQSAVHTPTNDAAMTNRGILTVTKGGPFAWKPRVARTQRDRVQFGRSLERMIEQVRRIALGAVTSLPAPVGGRLDAQCEFGEPQ